MIALPGRTTWFHGAADTRYDLALLADFARDRPRNDVRRASDEVAVERQQADIVGGGRGQRAPVPTVIKSVGRVPFLRTTSHYRCRVGIPAHASAFAFLPPRAMLSGVPSDASNWLASARQRPANSRAPSASSGESRTCATLFSMSSCDQPRE
jgi:hypothetical protein